MVIFLLRFINHKINLNYFTTDYYQAISVPERDDELSAPVKSARHGSIGETG